MELEEPEFEFKPNADGRPRMEQPIPVELEAIGDLRGPVPKCDLKKMDRLYRQILEFAPIEGAQHPGYQADNFALRFDVAGERPDYRPIRVMVKSLVAIQAKLADSEIEFSRQKGMMSGQEVLVLEDPDGNWLEIREHRDLG